MCYKKHGPKVHLCKEKFMKWYLGVDPGWTNLAYAWLDVNDNLITGCIAPNELPKGTLAPMLIEDALEPEDSDTLNMMAMERFVYYKGVHNPNSEQILMVTGQIQMWASSWSATPVMFRAFDWKDRLLRHMAKRGFKNPSKSLDKVFSLAAARFLFPEYDFKTDHEADAACMAYIARLLDR